MDSKFRLRMRVSFLVPIAYILLFNQSYCSELKNTFPVVKKCVCDYNEVQTTAEGCIPNDSLFIRFWDDVTETATVMNTSALQSSISISPLLSCPVNTTKIEEYPDNFFIDMDGNLTHKKNQNYCVEFVMFEGIVSVRVETCSDAIIPMCCGLDEVIDQDGNCQPIGVDRSSTDSLQPIVSKFEKYNIELRSHICESSEQSQEPIRLDFNADMVLESYQNFVGNAFCMAIRENVENDFAPVISYCPSKILQRPSTNNSNFLQLCCHFHEVYSAKNRTCSIPDTELKYMLPENIHFPDIAMDHIYTLLKCSTGEAILNINQNYTYQIAHNGSLVISTNDLSDSLKPKGLLGGIPADKYCLGAVLHENEIIHTGMNCVNNDIQYSIRFVVVKTCLIISSIFIILTLIVYLGVPDLRKRIGGFCLISELVALLLSHVTLLFLLEPGSYYFSNVSSCAVAGMIEIYAILASFFWLNVMCYDVWSTFSKFRPFAEKISKTKVMIRYSLYAWGVPLIITILAIVAEVTNWDWRPNFSPNVGCFFTENDLAVHWVYLYGIILILLLVNLFFFIHLATVLKPCKKNTRNLLKGGGSSSTKPTQTERENLKLVSKLFIIMGLPWIIEIITSFLNDEIFWFLDVINMLRGLLIFVIFVCKKTSRDMIVAAWYPRLKETDTSYDVSDERSRKTSTISLPMIFQSRKASKTPSRTSAANV